MEFPALRGRSILVVEDEPLIGWDIREAPEKAGATVTATTTVRHALILIEHDGLAGVIMDNALADGDSTEVCVRLKARGIPYVCYSGYDPVKGASLDACKQTCAHGCAAEHVGGPAPTLTADLVDSSAHGGNGWISHLSLPRTGTAGLASGCTGVHASPPLRECGQPVASLTAPATLRLRSVFPLVGRAFSFAPRPSSRLQRARR